MSSRSKHTIQRIYKLFSLTLVLSLMGGLFLAQITYADSAREIDVSVNIALERFSKDVKGADEFVKIAKGLLVLPNVIKAGFIIGGEYGEGALRVNGETVTYYSIAAGSFGFQIGAEKKDIIIAFMTGEALKQFRTSSGWEAGVDGNIAFVDIGGGKRIDGGYFIKRIEVHKTG
jgi:lipid-binding SYLF domain-containing protein